MQDSSDNISVTVTGAASFPHHIKIEINNIMAIRSICSLLM